MDTVVIALLVLAALTLSGFSLFLVYRLFKGSSS